MPTTHADSALLDLAWSTLKARRGETVTYYSGSANVELTAVFTQPVAAQVDGEENIVFQSRNWDALIDADWPDDAPDAFDGHEPKHGDKIVRSDGSAYMVQPSDALGSCWRYSDANHTWRRVYVEER